MIKIIKYIQLSTFIETVSDSVWFETHKKLFCIEYRHVYYNSGVSTRTNEELLE